VTHLVKALGSNVALATLNPDMFRGDFFSEKEAKNLLAPLRHALASRQGTPGRNQKALKS